MCHSEHVHRTKHWHTPCKFWIQKAADGTRGGSLLLDIVKDRLCWTVANSDSPAAVLAAVTTVVLQVVAVANQGKLQRPSSARCTAAHVAQAGSDAGGDGKPCTVQSLPFDPMEGLHFVGRQ